MFSHFCISVFEQKSLQQQMVEKAKSGDLHTVNSAGGDASAKQASKRRRWDQLADDQPAKKKSSWDVAESATPSNTRWDETPGKAKGSETPGATPGASTRMWDATPGHATPGAVTPGRDTQVTPSARRNRWDETPKTERGERKICGQT